MKKRISSALALLLAVSLLAGCGKSKEVRAVEKSIASIGEVTEETEAAIRYEDFWNASADDSEALPEEERESVSNYETLQEAEKRLEELRRLAEINAVEQEIADIGEVTEEKKEQIQNVREKYEALSEEEKGMVSNSDILREAEERLEKLKLLAIVGTWKSSIVGITLVYSFKEDGTYENYAQNPIGLKLSVQGGKGTYSYDGETVTLYHDGKENVFPVKITENSLVIMAADNNPIGDMIYTRVD